MFETVRSAFFTGVQEPSMHTANNEGVVIGVEFADGSGETGQVFVPKDQFNAQAKGAMIGTCEKGNHTVTSLFFGHVPEGPAY